jgi:hypothetical protein
MGYSKFKNLKCYMGFEGGLDLFKETNRFSQLTIPVD